MGAKSQARIAKLEKTKAKEVAQRVGWGSPHFSLYSSGNKQIKTIGGCSQCVFCQSCFRLIYFFFSRVLHTMYCHFWAHTFVKMMSSGEQGSSSSRIVKFIILNYLPCSFGVFSSIYFCSNVFCCLLINSHDFFQALVLHVSFWLLWPSSVPFILVDHTSWFFVFEA